MALPEPKSCPAAQSRCVAIIWPRFGPSHLARLEATGRLMAECGWRIVGVEIARTDDTYAWTVAAGAESFDRFTLFPESNYHTLTPRQIASAVSDLLNRTSPSAVATVGWSFPEARAGLGWCCRNDRPAICMSDSKRDDIPRTWWKEWLKRQVVKQFDAALVAGKPHVDYAAALGIPRERITVGVDVIDNEYFSTAAGKVRLHTESWRGQLGLTNPFFLTCCRYIPEKNLDRLLEAYSHYRKSTPRRPWDLVIAGGGDLGPALHRQASDLGLRGVHWPGFIQLGDLPRYYGLASAFILPSLKDTWGLVVNEAMASGLPVLVSRTVGCRYDLVEDGVNGYLFDPQSVEDIAHAMGKMASQSDVDRQAMGKRSEEIISRWGPERFAKGLSEALDLAEAQPRSRPWWSNPLGRLMIHPSLLAKAE